MKWVDRPEVPGWYWCWMFLCDNEPFPIAVKVWDGELCIGYTRDLAIDLVAKWHGPITSPELPE